MGCAMILVEQNFDANIVFQFLRSALKRIPGDVPLRGPSFFKKKSFENFNQISGTLAEFRGNEAIKQNGQSICRCTYMGGWVDRKVS
jgi:Domain of unknown function (DUF5680)